MGNFGGQGGQGGGPPYPPPNPFAQTQLAPNPQQQPTQPAQGYAPPPPQQGYPQQQQQQQQGYAPPQGYPPPGYPQQGPPPGYPPPGYPPQGGYPQQQPFGADPLGLTGMPTNPWIPSALISFFFPGIGLLLLPRPELKSMGIKIFVTYIVTLIGLPIVISIVRAITDIYAIGYLQHPLHLVRLVFHVGAMIYTHDACCKLNPSLGSPIFFKK